jgi:hypothetical protein
MRDECQQTPALARASGDDLGGEPGGIESRDGPLRDVICTARWTSSWSTDHEMRSGTGTIFS